MREEHKRFWYRYDKVQQGESVENIIDKGGATYAVLINTRIGDDIFPFAADLGYAHDCMVKSGIPNENIVILEGDDKISLSKGALPATSKNLEEILESMRSTITEEDTFVFGFFGHSTIQDPWIRFKLPDPEVYYSDFLPRTADTSTRVIKDFSKMLRSIKSNYSVYYFSQCHGGGFAKEVGIGNGIGISSCTRKQDAWGPQREDEGNYFNRPLFQKLFERGVTIESAFEYAAAHYINPVRILTKIVTPQLFWQNADPSTLYLGR